MSPYQRWRALSDAIRVFNCDVKEGSATVTAERVAEFYDREYDEAAAEAFEAYRQRVQAANVVL